MRMWHVWWSLLRVKVLPDVVGAAAANSCGRHFLLGGIVEESRFTSIPYGLVFRMKT
jgi:hypothetical protein